MDAASSSPRTAAGGEAGVYVPKTATTTSATSGWSGFGSSTNGSSTDDDFLEAHNGGVHPDDDLSRRMIYQQCGSGHDIA
eukprot:CAMPEP_0196812846 /NCGR_PEP_ID=MMETSP1362-20130617/31683_1 /TAXON_ID=163516 /ORGANISM="Leptocylindrus danicus, Strain CCMP1856" /LENGTH=79 /DNA_ID=CAMNT_0042188771 /DNA_START=233 /DNA_END=469 /DNA_ORIENTATION=+